MNPESPAPDMAPPGLGFAFRILLRFDAGAAAAFEPAYRAGAPRIRRCAGRRDLRTQTLRAGAAHSGGDWPWFSPGGLVDFEAHYQLEASDGTPVYIHNRGIAWSAPQVLARIEAGEPVAPEETYCRVTPRFEAPAGPHEWLTGPCSSARVNDAARSPCSTTTP